MKKHVGLLEAVGLVRTEKVGRTRRCLLGPQRLDREVAWIERHREAWSARFSALDAVLHQLQTEEASDAEPHDP